MSALSSRKYDGAQITTSSTHITKNQARETNSLACVANLSKTEGFPETSDGMFFPGITPAYPEPPLPTRPPRGWGVFKTTKPPF
ncbi:hypothetical protein GCM10022247_55930 [Allokutzneria multivorans]|uniref:Uncharacterized protein n=1 Tax=Allokutzneria multivorans TaxID=1142134 RepID=A0ABP7TCK6_9PSEU